MKRKSRKKQKVNSFDVSSFESYSSFELDLEYVGDGGETYGEPGYAVEGTTTVIVIEGNQSPMGNYEIQEGEMPMDQDEKVIVDIEGAAVENAPYDEVSPEQEVVVVEEPVVEVNYE